MTNERARIGRTDQQHPLLADRARLDKIVSNMDFEIQRSLYGRPVDPAAERALAGGVSARDVLQEALLDLLGTDPQSLSRTWEGLSVIIARRRAIDTLRESTRGRRRRDAPAGTPDDITLIGYDPPLHDDLVAASGDEAERAFVRNEQQKIILRVARELPDQEREIFFAIHFEGRTRVAVGDQLGLTPQRVGQIHKTALRKVWEQARSDPAFPAEDHRKESS